VRRPIKCLLCGAGALLAATAAHADPTDYIAIPIAKILKPGQFNLELVQTLQQWDVADEELATSFLTEFGLTERIEAGIDFNSLDDDAVIEADIKYQFQDPTQHDWGLAAGAFGLLSDDTDPFVYVTATRNIGKGSATAGAGSDGDVRAFFGASYPITSRLTGTGEFFTGESGFALASLAYKVTDGFTVAAWYQDFNDSPVEQLQVDLIFQSEF
jgi:hypothetical protein